MRLCTVVGARPQFIKYAALHHCIKTYPQIEYRLIHTGQHYDQTMSSDLFKELALPDPDINLQIGSHHPVKQISLMLEQIAAHLIEIKPEYLIVFGDTNSSLAAAIAASKLKIKIIHIEAGARSYNRSMPEEINRIIIDKLADYLFASSTAAMNNLRQEGLSNHALLSGDVMKDLLILAKEKNAITPTRTQPYVYATIHRPSNADDEHRLIFIISSLNKLDYPVIFSLHPRTKKQLHLWGIDTSQYQNIEWLEPVGYYDNLSYIHYAKAVVTDSGGMQKEAYWLETQCLTIRQDTEWPETLHDDWNSLVYDQFETLTERLLASPKNHNKLLYGDGSAATHIVEYLLAVASR